jgi:hypothetical protein
VKGPYLFGRSLCVPLTLRFFPSSQTWSPSFISKGFFVSLRRCRSSRVFWTCFLASSNWLMWSADAGTFWGRNLTCTWGLNPRRSLCRDFLVTLYRQELCTYSATGRSLAQLFCHLVAQVCRYCSTHAFILSVCPSVLGWKAVDRF